MRTSAGWSTRRWGSSGRVDEQIFLDYGRPVRWHPLRPVMAAVFHLLEPFAAALWKTEIRSLASGAEEYHWSRTMIFAGLYQKVVATRRMPLASGLT